MTKAERPDPRVPTFWMGTESAGDCWDKERFRILYPDGKTEWNLGFSWYWEHSPQLKWLPCWQTEERMSFTARVKAMKAYDKQRGAKTIFLANLHGRKR